MALPTLRRQKDIASFYTIAQRFRLPGVTLLLAPSPDGALRFLIVAGRKVGGAVVRNRVRRRLRAMLQEVSPELEGDWWIGLIAGPSFVDISSSEALARLRQVLRRAGALGGEEPNDR